MKFKKLVIIKKSWILTINKFIIEEELTPKHKQVWLLYSLATYVAYKSINIFYPEFSIVWVLGFNLFSIWIYFLLKVILLS